MRLATFDQDYWELKNAEAINAEHPETFWIPPLDNRRYIAVGMAARLIVEIESVDRAGGLNRVSERMNVIVSECLPEGGYVGRLDDKPASIEMADDVYLCPFAEIPFRPEHVIDITAPPVIYSENFLALGAERTWPPEAGDQTAFRRPSTNEEEMARFDDQASEMMQCGRHGGQHRAFVCQHLVAGSGLGFFQPDPVDEDARYSAWCGQCEEVVLRNGGEWDDETEAFADVTLICAGCFEEARARNMR